MEIAVAGDQLILSGPVVARDYDEVAGTLAAKPQIKIVILRNSPGGDAPHGTGLIHFYNPALVNIGGYSTFMCQGTEPDHPRIFDCERIPKTALDLGVATSTTLVHSSDQQRIHETILPTPPPSGYAAIADDSKLPGIGETGRNQYRRFLAAPSPRAFAIAPSGAWAWNSSLVPDAAWLALTRCTKRAYQRCQLYAVDDIVVWTAPSK